MADRLNPGDGLKFDSPITSPNGRYTFVYQSKDGNLVLYRSLAIPLWASGSSLSLGKGVSHSCKMQQDGNLVIYGHYYRHGKEYDEFIWESKTAGHPGSKLVVQNDGNVVIYDGTTPIWATNTAEPPPTPPPPIIVYWTRIEPRPYSVNFVRGLRAEIADPLWFLTRQWQMGEFIGHDGGSIAHGEIKSSSTQLARYAAHGKPGQQQVVPLAFNNDSPLEMCIEREKVVPSLKLRVQMGQNFERMLSIEDFNRYVEIFRAVYPLNSPSSEDKAAKRYFAFMNGRVMDGYNFKKHLDSSLALSPPQIPSSLSTSIDSSDREAILRIALEFYKWCITIYNEPEGNDPNCWVNERMEYNFLVSARSFDGDGNRETVLVAPEYSEGSLDWYSFSVNPNVRLEPQQPKLQPTIELEAAKDNFSVDLDVRLEPQQDKPPAIERHTSTFLPANVTFKGMPNKRWWDFEDASISIGDIEADKRDIAKMIVMDFALVSDNDWFMIPLPIKIGSLTRINSLIVTDVFGERFLIKSADENLVHEGEKGWSMFKLSYVPVPGQPCRVTDFLFLPPSHGPSLESPDIEKINLVRDEMANMAWAIEQLYEGDLGEPISGYESDITAATATRNTEKERGAASSSSPEGKEEQSSKKAKIKYIMQTRVPTNWIPFLPVRVSESNHAVDLQLGQMLEHEPGVDTKPKTKFLQQQQQGENNSRNEYRIKEEEIPRAGVLVSRRFQRARWIDGSTYLWIGRRKSAGHGEGSSGLRFDVIEENK